MVYTKNPVCGPTGKILSGFDFTHFLSPPWCHSFCNLCGGSISEIMAINHVSFPREYDSLFEVYPYSCLLMHNRLNKEMILQGMTGGLKWENIVTLPKRSIQLGEVSKR